MKGEVGARVDCAICHRAKQPRGRSAPLDSDYCDWDCPGYNAEPHVGSLWPGETRRAFGFGLPPDDAARCYASDDPLECARAAIARLRAESAAHDSQLSMLVATLGGEVEGAPTGKHNYLQRVRALLDENAALKKTAQRLSLVESALRNLRVYTEHMFSPEWLANQANRGIFAHRIYAIIKPVAQHADGSIPGQPQPAPENQP